MTSLTLYIPENFGAERTVISYIGTFSSLDLAKWIAILTASDDNATPSLFSHCDHTGLKGEFKTLSRKAVNVTYESAAQLKDHKVPESEQMARHIGQ